MTELVDTSALFALLDADDRNHPRARAHLQAVLGAGDALLTHEYVLVETIALVQRRLGLGPLRSFLDDLLPLIDVAWVDEALHLEAREALLAAGQRQVSLVDQVSFLVMRRHGIRRAFAFDADFGAAGFDVVPSA